MRYVLFLLIVFTMGCESKKLQVENQEFKKQIANLQPYQNRANECERLLDQHTQERESRKKRAELHLQRARNRVALDKEWQQVRLAKLEELIRQATSDPEQAARVENNLFNKIQRYDLDLFEVAHYEPLNKEGRLVDPVMALTMIKSYAYGPKNFIFKNEDQRRYFLRHLLGDEEGDILADIDLSAFYKK